MDAIDNPSYFALPEETVHKKLSQRCADTRHSLPRDKRRTKPSLLRTTSADTQLLVQGKPRPSDVAPKLRRQRFGSLGNAPLSHDMVQVGRIGPDDVFADKPLYYNTAANHERRHSIGSFLQPVVSQATDARRRIQRCRDRVGSKMAEDELDILVVSCGESEAATVWVNYLISCFEKIAKERNKPLFKIQCVKLEDALCPPIGNSQHEKCPDARLQIVIMCPLFIQTVRNLPVMENSLSKTLHPDKVLTMMLGVGENAEDSRIKSLFPNYERWRKMNVKDLDTTSVSDFLGVAMDILSRSWQIQEAIISSEQEHIGFSIIPKKVKVGQNKVIMLLVEPLIDSDMIKIFVDKNEKKIEIANVKKRNPYTMQFNMPVSCLQVSLLVNVYVEKNGKPIGRRAIKCESKMRELDQILRSVDNPLNFMCQSFGISTTDREHLDTFLLTAFQKNVPRYFNLLNPTIPINKSNTCNEEFPTLLHFAAKYGLEKLTWQLMESPGGEQACQIRNCSHLTPADMADKANHSKLSSAIKGYMQMTELSSVYNYLKGISDKPQILPECNYRLPRPVSDTYLIPPAARPVDPSIVQYSASDSSPTSPFYTNFKPCNFSLPSPTSPSSNSVYPLISPMENYQVPKNGRPCTPPTPSSPMDRTFGGYLEMNSPGMSSSNFGSASSFNTCTDMSESFGEFGKLETGERNSISSDSHHLKPGSDMHLSKEKLSPEDELLEIINDFKNHVFTISEVEALVESWQNRNDVQQSFRDKQEQLNKMREEYERIQKKMKDQMRRATPLEKIRKFFSRNKSKHSDCSERTSIGSDISLPQARPASSISLQSSSSGSSITYSVISKNGPTDSGSIRSEDHKSSTSLEKLYGDGKMKTSNHYSEIPHPPKQLDLSAGPDFEYVQPDCMVCRGTRRTSSCSGSIVNDTIHECVEFDQTESILQERSKPEIRITDKKASKKEKEKNKLKYKTNSLKIDSAKKKEKRIKNKVKSAENLSFESGDKNNGKEDTCGALCSESLKCISSTALPVKDADVITFEFDKTDNIQIVGANETGDSDSHTDLDKSAIVSSSNVSECGSSSRKSSSLDLSSLSLNSNCTVDENGEINEEKCSLELKITGEAEVDSQCSPAYAEAENYVNIYKIPEYVNVNVENPPPLPRRCKYTVVST